MNIDKRWTLVFAAAVGAGAGVLIASRMRGKHQRRVQDLESRKALKSWENEGGNLAPTPMVAASPAGGYRQ